MKAATATGDSSNDPAAKGSAAAKRFDGDVARSVAASGEIVGHGSVDPHANRASASNEIITKSASQNHPASSSSDWLVFVNTTNIQKGEDLIFVAQYLLTQMRTD